jgi:hypothetical protein
MATRTEAQIQTELDEVHVALRAAVTSPKPSYSIGSRRFSWNQYYEWLLRRARGLKEEMSSLPVEVVTTWKDPG